MFVSPLSSYLTDCQFGCLDNCSSCDDHRNIRQLSVVTTGKSRDTSGIRPLCVVEPCRLVVGLGLHHIRVRSWLRRPSGLVLIITILATAVPAQLLHLYSTFSGDFDCNVQCESSVLSIRILSGMRHSYTRVLLRSNCINSTFSSLFFPNFLHSITCSWETMCWPCLYQSSCL